MFEGKEVTPVLLGDSLYDMRIMLGTSVKAEDWPLMRPITFVSDVLRTLRNKTLAKDDCLSPIQVHYAVQPKLPAAPEYKDKPQYKPKTKPVLLQTPAMYMPQSHFSRFDPVRPADTPDFVPSDKAYKIVEQLRQAVDTSQRLVAVLFREIQDMGSIHRQPRNVEMSESVQFEVQRQLNRYHRQRLREREGDLEEEDDDDEVVDERPVKAFTPAPVV